MHTTHRIDASWSLDRGDVWCPLHGAEVLYVISCYVGIEGWRTLERHLLVGAERHPSYRAVLIFSRRGIEQSGGASLLEAMRTFLDRGPMVAGVEICVIDDASTRELFHPKAHASRTGKRTRVVVGSANLTRGGMHEHYEMAAVTENDPEVWEGFIAAIAALRAKACSLRDDNNLRILRAHADSPAWPSSAGAPSVSPVSAPRDRLEAGQLELPVHATADIEQARQLISAFFATGYKLSRSQGSLEFRVTIQLGRLLGAKVLKATEKTQLSRNVSMDTGSGDLKLRLFSRGFETRILHFKNLVGSRYGATTVELAGITWSPQVWVAALRALWQADIDALAVDELPEAAQADLPHLLAEFDTDGAGFLALERDLRIAEPCEWYSDLACKILELHDLPQTITPELRRRITSVAAHELQHRFSQELATAASSSRFVHLRNLPRPASVFTPSTGDMVELLADVALLAVAAHTDSGEGANNRLAACFAAMLAAEPSSRAIIQTAQGWKQQLSVEPMPTLEQQEAIFAVAWAQFRRWFKDDVFASRYFECLPDLLRKPSLQPS